jgi:hypothetical protein
MPFARLGLNKLIGGTLLALTLGGLNPASAQTANLTNAPPFAGTYIGATQPVASNDPSCDPGGRVAFAVQDGRFSLPWHEPQAFHVRILADGSFFATSGNAIAQSDKHMMLVPTLQGRVSGASLVADYGTRWCRYRLEATRS